jgi:glycosyltransferase involved in cell wall biosynthesis
MKRAIGMLGPISVDAFRDHLDRASRDRSVAKGLGGTPVNLLSLQLLRRGWAVTIFTLDPGVEDELLLEGPGLRICVGPFRRIRARDFFKIERRYLLRAIQRERPDILHAHWTYEYALAAQASGLPHLITAHDAPINVLRHNFIPYRIARTMMAYRVLTRAANVISVSPHVANHLRRFMLYRGPTEVVPNGMPAELFATRRVVRSMTDPITYATVVNGWGGLKNAQAALRAFALVHAKRPCDRLVMFGADYGAGEPAEIWAKEKGIAEGVHFVGALPHEALIARLAAEVDIVVHPSLEEAHPMAILEATALGIPTVGGQSSGAVPWTLDGGRAGLLVDVTSPRSIEAAMLQLATSDVERHVWGQRGREHTERCFHIGAVAAAYEARYAALAEHR